MNTQHLKFDNRKYISTALKMGIWFVIFIFSYTGISKLTNVTVFQTDMSKSIFIPELMIVPLSYFVPIAEAFLSIGLLTSRYFKVSLLLSSLLMWLFTIYVAFLYFFSPDIPCSCGGIISSLSWPQHIILNVVLSLILTLSYLIKLRPIL